MSIAVFVYLAYQIYYNWYPEPYFSIDGGWQGIRLVGAVDLVLGPFITFLIFDLRKKRREILFDLVTILVIQFGALAYGVYATYTQRPVAVVVIDQFRISATMEHYGGKLASASDLQRFSDEKPPIIYSDFPIGPGGHRRSPANKTRRKGARTCADAPLPAPVGIAAALQNADRGSGLLASDGLQQTIFRSGCEQNGQSADEVLISRVFRRVTVMPGWFST